MNVSESNHIQKIRTADELKTAVLDAVDTQSVTDIHTHTSLVLRSVSCCYGVLMNC